MVRFAEKDQFGKRLSFCRFEHRPGVKSTAVKHLCFPLAISCENASGESRL